MVLPAAASEQRKERPRRRKATEAAAGLPAGDRCVMITFDDGYRNNLRALPLLREFGACATFFVATGFVRSGRAFWWDVFYREMRSSGASSEAITRERAPLKERPLPEIEGELAPLLRISR